MGKILSLLTLSVCVLLIFNCAGSIGGIVLDREGNPVEGALVRLIVIDDEGEEIRELSVDISKDEGRFDLKEKGTYGASLIVEAHLPSGHVYRSFAYGSGWTAIVGPVSDAMVRAVIYVTETAGGSTLSDFSNSELRAVDAKVVADWDRLMALDTEDTANFVREVIKTAGRTIPDAAGGRLSAVDLTSVLAENIVTDDSPTFETISLRPCVRDNYWIESSLFGFDVLEDGALCRSNSQVLGLYSAYDIAYQLSIEGDTFVLTGNGSFPGDGGVHVPDIYVEDDREICFGPVSTAAGISVLRKVYVPDSGDYARYLEIFSNPTGSDVSLDVQIRGSLGIGEFVIYGVGIQTLVEESGNLLIDIADNWAASISSTPNNPHPTVAYVWDGTSGYSTIDGISFPPSNSTQSFYYGWNDVIIPAGSTKVFMHFAYLTGSSVAHEAAGLLKSAHHYPDETGMSLIELNALQNFPVTVGNIRGEAGSVPSFCDLEVTNNTSLQTASGMARRDGGFNVNIDAEAGDEITVISKIEGLEITRGFVIIE